MPSETSVVDASGLILGRLASVVAKRLLSGEKLTVVNADKAIISGRRRFIVKSRKEFLAVGSFGHGPYHPRRPDTILRRTVRGMLPWRQPKGKDAYRRLQVYVGVPEELRGSATQTVSEADASQLRSRYMTLADVAEAIGWKRGVD